MSAPTIRLLTGILLVGTACAQAVPATPKKFVTRPIEGGGGSIGGVEILPRDGATSQNVRYTTIPLNAIGVLPAAGKSPTTRSCGT